MRPFNIVCIFGLLLICACTQEQRPMHETEGFQQYVIDESELQPQTYEIIDTSEPSTEENFERNRINREYVDYVNTMREDTPTFAEAEEERIEAYCKEYGFEACMKIDRACEDDGCHKVTVTCDDDYDEDEPNSCRRFDVDVREYYDKALTEDSDAEIIEDGKDEP
jgi:hypothetical protein